MLVIGSRNRNIEVDNGTGDFHRLIDRSTYLKLRSRFSLFDQLVSHYKVFEG